MTGISVHPLTWKRMVRDHGPRGAANCKYICALYALHSRMKEGGNGGGKFCSFVGLRQWAADARVSVRYIGKLRDRAIAEGWLFAWSVEIKTRTAQQRGARRRTYYRCTVPAALIRELTEDDSKLENFVDEELGPIDSSLAAAPLDDGAPDDAELCPLCGAQMHGNLCPSCGVQIAPRKRSRTPRTATKQNLYPRDAARGEICVPGDASNRESVSPRPQSVSPIGDTEVSEVSQNGSVLRTEAVAGATGRAVDRDIEEIRASAPDDAEVLTKAREIMKAAHANHEEQPSAKRMAEMIGVAPNRLKAVLAATVDLATEEGANP